MSALRGPVLLVLVDGLRPDALAASCPQLSSLRSRGAWTLSATSVFPPRTLPCHLSIFHGVAPIRHGVEWNEWTALPELPPTFLDLAWAGGLRSAAVFNWGPLRMLARPDSLDAIHYRNSLEQPDGDDQLVAAAQGLLGEGGWDLLFLYLGTVDVVGHAQGYMSAPYLRQAERVDTAIGRLLATLPEAAHVLVLSDHGGHEWDHGTDDPDDMLIPWILTGPRIRPGYEIPTPVSLLDTAPTLARLLGITPDPGWDGRSVDEAFVD